MPKIKREIGCSRCRQSEDIGQMILKKEYDAGWLGHVTVEAELENYPECMDENYEYHENDSAKIYLSLWQNKPHSDSPLFDEDIEIKFCPFCGTKLEDVRNYMRNMYEEDNKT